MKLSFILILLLVSLIGYYSLSLEKSTSSTQIVNPIQLSKAPRSVKEWLSSKGNLKITAIEIRRNALAITNKLLDAVSLGKFNENMKKLGYSKLYHTSFVLTLSDNKKYRLEKGPLVKIMNLDNREEEVRTVAFNMKTTGITTNQLFNSGINNKAKNDIWLYNAFKNNCQHFIYDLLVTSKLLTDDDIAWFKQDIEKLDKLQPGIVDIVFASTTVYASIQMAAQIYMQKAQKLADDIKKATQNIAKKIF